MALTARAVTTAKDGSHSDGNGLYLKVRNGGSTRFWVFRWKVAGKARELGLGGVALVSLKDAREIAQKLRKAIHDGKDPAIVLHPVEERRLLAFEELTAEHIAIKSPEWRNEKHAWQWQRTMEMFVFPIIGKLTPDKITTDHILRILTPIWSTKLETAMRVRQRIEAVISRAIALKMRERGEGNPAAWDDHLEHLLPSPKKLRRESQPVVHHPALPHAEIGPLLEELRGVESISSLCLQFITLTAVRSGEARKARWEEIDWKEKTWTIPASRMKAKRKHVVPLSAPALRILRHLLPMGGELIFPSPMKPAQAISDLAVIHTLHRLRPDVTVHGMRSAFRDWCSEESSASHEVIEMSLAHTIKDKTEAAYFRSDLLEKRRTLMDQWAEYLVGPEESPLRQVI